MEPNNGSDDSDNGDQTTADSVTLTTVQITFAMLIRRNLYPKFQEASQEDRVGAISKLTHVRLDRENIGTIDNLDSLGPVTNLYLQKNLIEHIENLDVMPKLTFLVLSGNRISTVENLTGLINLKLLDLSENFIEDFDGEQFPKSLIILNLEMNPCCDRSSYKTRLLEVLFSLKTLDGVEITKRDRMIADCYVSDSDDNTGSSEDLTVPAEEERCYEDSEDEKQEEFSDDEDEMEYKLQEKSEQQQQSLEQQQQSQQQQEQQQQSQQQQEQQQQSSPSIHTSADRFNDNPESMITDDIREGVSQSEQHGKSEKNNENVEKDMFTSKHKLPPLRTAKHKSDKTLTSKPSTTHKDQKTLNKQKKTKATKMKTENKKAADTDEVVCCRPTEETTQKAQVEDDRTTKKPNVKTPDTKSIQKTLADHGIKGSFKDLSVKFVSRSQDRSFKQQGRHEQRMNKLEKLRLKLEPVTVREFNSADVFTEQQQQPYTARF